MTGSPYRDAAVLYFDAGWPGPLPLPANAKRDPPKGYTGIDGAWPSRADVQAWCDNGQARHNIALRLPDDVIGIDVDMYDGKQGRATLEALEADWGPLPDTWMSSSRDDGSGIRFYRVPAGHRWPSVPGPGIEIIQHGHRYAVVWPSVHPNGATYRWTTLDGLAAGLSAGRPPSPSALTELPARWIDGLEHFRPADTGTGWTDPDIDALIEHGIQKGVNQDEALRDAVWKMRRDGYSRNAARSAWKDIVANSPQLDPSWPWDTGKDFGRHWKGADAKLPRPLTVLEDTPRPKEASNDAPIPLFVDVAMLLAEGLPPVPAPTVLRRMDGVALFYAEKVNVLFGDPECGKTWIAYAAVVETLAAEKRAAIIDTDHNGVTDIITRLVSMGADPKKLGDPGLFKLAEPEDKEQLLKIVESLRFWAPHVAVVDSVGEILPMLGFSSNSPDDYTTAHRLVLTALARSGAAVVAIDHLPKADEARVHGQTGTVAKRRAVGGISLRVTLTEVFTPGRGGSASLSVHKDRPGGLRQHCPVDGKYQPAGRFVMTDDLEGKIDYRITEPRLSDANVADDDIAELDALDPPPKSQRDVQERLQWGGTRAMAALKAWRVTRG